MDAMIAVVYYEMLSRREKLLKCSKIWSGVPVGELKTWEFVLKPK